MYVCKKHACSNLSFMYVCSSTYLSTYMNSIKHSVYSIIKHSLIIKPVVLIDFVKKEKKYTYVYKLHIRYSICEEISFTNPVKMFRKWDTYVYSSQSA